MSKLATFLNAALKCIQNIFHNDCTIETLSQLAFLSTYYPTENKQSRFRCFLSRCMNPVCLCCVTYCIYLQSLSEQMVLSSLLLQLLSLVILSPSTSRRGIKKTKTFLSFINNSTCLIKGLNFLIKHVPFTLH